MDAIRGDILAAKSRGKLWGWVHTLVLAAALACQGLPGPEPAYAQTVVAEATAALAQPDGDVTVFSLTLSRGVQAQIFTVDNPYRVIIDLPDVAFKLPPGTGAEPAGLIKVFRYGLFAEHKARVVIEARGPVKVVSAGMTRAGQGQAVVLKVSLAATDEATFAAGIAEAQSQPEETTLPVAPPPEKSANAKPVVVIDPGHGGIDPGAIGAGNVTEKAIVFAVAQQLEAVLKASKRYEVRMTRTRDVFVPLDKRVKMSAEFSADLFISLHADAIAEMAFAENIRGATVYTLSERATDERSRLMAEKENASDLIAGLSGVNDDNGDQVKDILYDLLRRETLNFSADFSNLLVSRLSKSIAMSKDPQRSAAFKVLKQPHAPSVLIELGYMSNSRDQATMTTKAWQTKVAEAIGAAVDSYFNKRTAVHP